jgi:hypothetical protein
MKWMLIGAVLALALAGCGARSQPAEGPAAAEPARAQPRDLVVFRRVRFEGATLNVLHVRSDGSLEIDVPNGGAGGAEFASRLTPRALRGIRHALAATPWESLSRKRVRYDHSGAYFMLHRAGEDYIAMADGMSRDLLPIVARLNAVLNGAGQVSEKRVAHRFGKV